ncbi:hypothetical protein BGZ51_009608 [Haplosporangium sp. Z 767]|nr:hypothetical protein BGZ51_009608 [Haplosporangium sp. Z 767]
MEHHEHHHHHRHEQGQESLASSSSSTFFAPVVDMVDMTTIEREKENIQPLRQGRSAQALSRLFNIEPAQREQELTRQREQFLEELEQIDDMDDPLDVYVRFVKWTIENYPTSTARGHDSKLMPILEQAFQTFKDISGCKNDPRFIRLLVLYAEKGETPLDVYRYMESNDIGSEISMYYHEYAGYLESQGEFDMAKDVYTLGVNRRARPLGKLKKQLEEFLEREKVYLEMQERERMNEISQSSDSNPNRPMHSGAGANRRVLGVRISGSESIPSNVQVQGHRELGSAESSSSRATSGFSNNQRPNARLKVYSDQASKSGNKTRGQENTPWQDLGAELVRRKENIREATAWQGVKLTAEDTRTRRPIPKLQVYCDAKDDEPGQDSAQQANSNAQHSDHLQQVSVSQRNTSQQKPSDISHQENQPEFSPHRLIRGRFPVTINAYGKSECLMVDLTQIYADEQEFAVEEIRARHPRYAARFNRIGVEFEQVADGNYYNTPYTPTRPSHHAIIREPMLPIRPVLPISPSEEEHHASEYKRRLTSSPTLNTRYASKEMNRLFSDRSRARKSMDSQWSTEDSQDVGLDELDNFTMAYSIQTASSNLSPGTRAYLENDIQDEFGDDDDSEPESGGRTEEFVKRLEQGFGSTITQDIDALRRKRDARASFGDASQSHRLSLRKRSLGRFDPNRTMEESDITIAIRQKAKEQQHLEHHDQHEQDVDATGFSYGHYGSRSSLGSSRLSTGSRISAEGFHRNVDEDSSMRSAERQAKLAPPGKDVNIFREDVETMDADMNIPMLEDEAPPSQLDRFEPY